MAISHVEIDNFLVFKGEFACDFCPGVNVLIGGNATGKTTLLKCLYAALASEKDVNTSVALKEQGREVRALSFIPMRSVSWREIAPPANNTPAQYSVAVTATDVDGKSVTTMTKTTDDFINLIANGKPVSSDQIPDSLRIHKLQQGKNIVVKSHVFIPEFDLVRTVQNFRREIDLFINGRSDNHTQWFNENILSQEQSANGNLGRLIEDVIHLYCPDAISISLFITLFNLAATAQTFFTDKKTTEVCDKICQMLEKKGIIFSGVTFSQDLKSFVFSNGISAMYEASGIRKFGLLWLLIKYKLLELHNSSVLFWDEPENSLNPELMSVLVDILLELQRGGVQIFLATHNYTLARYFDLKKRNDDKVQFFNLSKDSNGQVTAVSSPEYTELPESILDKADEQLYKAVVASAMGIQDDD